MQCAWINARHRVEYGAGFHYTFPHGLPERPHILSTSPPKFERKVMGVFTLWPSENPFSLPLPASCCGFPAISPGALWCTCHQIRCSAASPETLPSCGRSHMPENIPCFFRLLKPPAAVRVHSAMTFSAKFLNFPDISKKIFTETYPLIPALSGGIFCNRIAKQYITLHYLHFLE